MPLHIAPIVPAGYRRLSLLLMTRCQSLFPALPKQRLN